MARLKRKRKKTSRRKMEFCLKILVKAGRRRMFSGWIPSSFVNFFRFLCNRAFTFVFLYPSKCFRCDKLRGAEWWAQFCRFLQVNVWPKLAENLLNFKRALQLSQISHFRAVYLHQKNSTSSFERGIPLEDGNRVRGTVSARSKWSKCSCSLNRHGSA